jgi:hypothetical protein
MTVSPSQAAESNTQAKRIAEDGRHQDNYLDVPIEVIFDQSLTEGAIALWILLSSIGLRLGQGVILKHLMAKLPCSRRSLFVYMKALADRGLLGWVVKGEKYFFTLTGLEWVYGELSDSRAPAPHAVIHDGAIPIRAKLMLFTLKLQKQLAETYGDGNLYVSQAKLDSKLHWGDKAVRRWLTWLEKEGLQTVVRPQRQRCNGKWTSLHRELQATTERYVWPEKDQSSAGMTARSIPASAGMTARLEAPSAGMTALITPENPNDSIEPHHPPAGGAGIQGEGSFPGEGRARQEEAPHAQENPLPPRPSFMAPEAHVGTRRQRQRARKAQGATERPQTPQAGREAKPARSKISQEAFDLLDRFIFIQNSDSPFLPGAGKYYGYPVNRTAFASQLQSWLDKGYDSVELRAAITEWFKRPGGGIGCPWAVFLTKVEVMVNQATDKDPSNRKWTAARARTTAAGVSYFTGRPLAQNWYPAHHEWYEMSDEERATSEKEREDRRVAQAEARAKQESERKAREAEEEAQRAAERALLIEEYRKREARCDELISRWDSGATKTDEERAEFREHCAWLRKNRKYDPANNPVATPA